MLERIAQFIATIGGIGVSPRSIANTLAIFGLLVLMSTVAIFIRHAWDMELGESLMAWTAMFMALGLVMIWTAGNSGPKS